MYYAVSTVFMGWYNVVRRQVEPADTTVLETKMENDISDQKNSENNAGSV